MKDGPVSESGTIGTKNSESGTVSTKNSLNFSYSVTSLLFTVFSVSVGVDSCSLDSFCGCYLLFICGCWYAHGGKNSYEIYMYIRGRQIF